MFRWKKKKFNQNKNKFFSVESNLTLENKNVPLEQMFRWKKIKNVLLELTEKKEKITNWAADR